MPSFDHAQDTHGKLSSTQIGLAKPGQLAIGMRVNGVSNAAPAFTCRCHSCEISGAGVTMAYLQALLVCH